VNRGGQGKHRTAIAQIAAEARLSIAEFRRVVQTVQRGEREASRAKKEMVEANLGSSLRSPRDMRTAVRNSST
jgi:DNA-directed RNA polymerase sigma subunit (sigma70/sigma32)